MALTTSLQSQSPLASSKGFGSSGKAGRSFRSAWNKVGQYLKEQAVNNSENHSTLYLSPPAPRWTQRNDFVYEINDDDLVGAQIARKLTVLNYYAPAPPPYSYCQNPTPPSSRSPSYEMSDPVPSVTGPGVLQNITRHQYASDNILQSYDMLIPERHGNLNSGKGDALWIVYIHGGYFRDPTVDSTSFKPAITVLEDSPHKNEIAGYCSINYRLSVHNVHPQDPNTPKYTLNNARWPDQPTDILLGLSHLQSHHPDSKNYILCGHSVGATLAFLAALDSHTNSYGIKITPPKALLGISGIYDFPAIHKSHPSYETLTKNAMDKSYYTEASPALYDAAKYLEKWHPEQEKRIVVLAHSKDDGLVPWEQPEEMMKVFDGQPQFKAQLLEIYGQHNPIFEKGTELARAIGTTIDAIHT